jgi:uncharacterized NAD(P)/FAD-binding protein YdhS
MTTFLVIGAGFSGAIIAAQLMRQTNTLPVRVYLLNGTGRIARGMAYGTQSSHHVLNVPAGNMSAFPEDPDHFLQYAQKADASTTAASFVSRRLYGDYLEWLLNEAERLAPPNVELHRVYRQVTKIEDAPGGTKKFVTLDDNNTMVVDRVVLALGHFSSSSLPITNADFSSSPRYLHDPWDQARLDAIPARARVMLLGTGLTSIDVAMTLLSRNPDRSIIALSRRGLLPQAHRHAAGKPPNVGVETIWGDAATIREQLRAFRRYCSHLAAKGCDWREALAMLRPVTADIWLAYTDKERRRFLRHVQPYWDTHRHRLAPAVAEQFSAALASGVIQTLAGRIFSMEDNNGDIRLTLRRRGHHKTDVEDVQYVVNCTGPCADPRMINSDLVKQMLNDGVICTDSLRLGIQVTEDCAVISANGHPSKNLFYIGPWLKAKYWESTAVPDLRVFATRLVERIMHENRYELKSE